MERVRLKELNMKTRSEAVLFLKRLWNEDEVDCPICGCRLELLHKKAKKSELDWKCARCDKVYKTIHLLDEINAAYR